MRVVSSQLSVQGEGFQGGLRKFSARHTYQCQGKSSRTFFSCALCACCWKIADHDSLDSRDVAALLMLLWRSSFLPSFIGYFRRSLKIAFIDLMAAFEFVDRAALWNSLEGIRVPSWISFTTCTPTPHHMCASGSRLNPGLCACPTSSAMQLSGCCLGWSLAASSEYAWARAVLLSLTTLTKALCRLQWEPRVLLSCRGLVRRLGTWACTYNGWVKSPRRNVGHDAALPALTVSTNTADPVSESCLSSKISSDTRQRRSYVYTYFRRSSSGYSSPEVMCFVAHCDDGHESTWPDL